MKSFIEKANASAIKRMLNSQPVWIDVKPAHEVFPFMDRFSIFHAGAPIRWEHMCQPMKAAVVGSLKYEGLASSDEEALFLASSGKISYSPCHRVHAVGPMTGIITYSMPLLVVKDSTHGNVAYSTINEGSGDVLRFGFHSENTISRLKWIEKVFAPCLKRVVEKLGGLGLKALMAQALQMGDELHMRNQAASALLIKNLIPALADTPLCKRHLQDIVGFLTRGNDQFFLNFAMAAQKVAADAAHGIKGSTLVTAIARNGVDVGIKVSGLGEKWFTAPAPPIDGLYFPGFSKIDANPDLGDSAIMETCGLGGFAMAAAPAIVKLLGAGTYKEALNYTQNMFEIVVAENDQFLMPNLDFRGTPTGIDIRKVVETGIAPVINTAIAGKNPGTGMIGAGVAEVPLEIFQEALIYFAEQFYASV